MSVNRHWCWEFESSGYGPDWFCNIEITPESVAHLEALITQLSLPFFTPMPIYEKYCYRHQKLCSYHIFVNESNTDLFRANLAVTDMVNIWIYHLIEIHNETITIECGYGGYPQSEYHTIETSFLLDLCDNPNIAIAQWHLYAGGMGYDSVTVTEGKTSAELKQHITG
ncbi:hypothetical protein [Nostoc sp. MS1]|uniref:hypothetical protein n=1 Tax=Nostoc sp. MS1 TaxID=2764711 RepID=UPI001CC4FA35|nr:hypothetical protein [Nostoc sp. MS1]BCL38038.1 hypothetical protein NSMS1_44850 [Nostoc sp. MS1]